MTKPIALLLAIAGCGSRPSPAPATPTADPGPEPGVEAPQPRVPVDEVAMVFVNLHDGRLSLQASVDFDERAVGDEVDLVDCRGWVGRGHLVGRDQDDGGWLVYVDAAAPDLGPGPCVEEGGWSVFVIVPADPSRADRRTPELDPTATFASLPADDLAWHEAYLQYYQLPPDGVSSWADLDGDGAVDLVELVGLCKPNDDYTCSKILLDEGGTWREVGWITPA